MNEQMFAAGGALAEKMEDIIFKKEKEAIVAFRDRLDSELPGLEEAINEKCPG